IAQPASKPSILPAGVDTSVARSASAVANEILVGYAEDSLAQSYREKAKNLSEEGQPLLEIIRKRQQSPGNLLPADSVAADELGRKGDIASDRAKRIRGRAEFSDLADTDRQRAAQLLETARDYYERSLQLNPWDDVSYTGLVDTYLDLADVHLSSQTYDAAIEVIEKWLAIGGSSDYYLFLLGECFRSTGDTARALLAYRNAEDQLLLATCQKSEGIAADTIPSFTQRFFSTWWQYVSLQYSCELSLGFSADAVRDLERCVEICRAAGDTVNLRILKGNLDALAWDSGDLEAFMLRNKYSDFLNDGRYEDARAILNDLLPILDSPKAIFEVRYWAATLDFHLQEYEQGLKEMRSLLRDQGFSEVDSSLDSVLTKWGKDGFARRLKEQRSRASDPLRELLDNYSAACFRYGTEIEKMRRDRKRAFVYFYQAALIPSKNQTDALLALADLSENQPERAVSYAETAIVVSDEAALTPEQRSGLYKILVQAYRRLNDKPHAEHYHRLYLNSLPGATHP
ncbi:hypothetical protein KKH27_08235, partial [bacterium]|nr:hypothetical protein [bacterium]MBU1983864.1 hypothetical protein [bacterium]